MSTSERNNAPGFELDRENHSIKFVRRVATTPERMFAAWIDPDQLTQWWDPSGRPLVSCEVDAREGGRFRFVNAGREHMPFEGNYVRVTFPIEIVFDAMGARGTIRFENVAAGHTRMTVSIRCSSPDHLKQFLEIGIAEDTAQTLDNLVAFAG